MALTQKERWARYYKKHRARLLARNKTYRGRMAYRNRHLKRKYGIRHKDYIKLFKQQNGKCAICNCTPRAKGRRIKGFTRFVVDHNHKTKEVRGLLCAHCNAALGFLRDNVDLVFKAFTYLKDRQ